MKALRLVVMISISAACNSSPGSDSGDTMEEPDGVLGYLWCVEANPARGHWQTPPGNGQYIIDPATHWHERGCECYCPEDSTKLFNGTINNLIGADLTWYNGQVLALKGKALTNCGDRVAWYEGAQGDMLLFNTMFDVTCEDAVDDEIPFNASTCVQDEDVCDIDQPIPGTGGMEQVDDTAADGGGALAYGIDDFNDVIYCQSSDSCQIDVDFVIFLLDDISIFSDDYIGMTVGESGRSNRGFKFEWIGTQSLPYALGFRDNDYVWEINGSDFYSIAHVTALMEALYLDYEFTVKVDRGTVLVTQTYEIVDMGSYP